MLSAGGGSDGREGRLSSGGEASCGEGRRPINRAVHGVHATKEGGWSSSYTKMVGLVAMQTMYVFECSVKNPHSMWGLAQTARAKRILD